MQSCSSAARSQHSCLALRLCPTLLRGERNPLSALVREGTSCGFLRSCWWLPSHASIHYVFGTNNRCFGRVEQPSQSASTRRTLVNHIRQQHLNLLQPFEGLLCFHHASRGPFMLSTRVHPHRLLPSFVRDRPRR